MSTYNLGSGRMVCWDDFLIDKAENTEIRMHKPVKREKVFTCDKFWEGNVCGYMSMIKLGDTYRLYYRAQNLVCNPDGTMVGNRGSFCIAGFNRASWLRSLSALNSIVGPSFGGLVFCLV
jgi:hypothetical protein